MFACVYGYVCGYESCSNIYWLIQVSSYVLNVRSLLLNNLIIRFSKATVDVWFNLNIDLSNSSSHSVRHCTLGCEGRTETPVSGGCVCGLTPSFS